MAIWFWFVCGLGVDGGRSGSGGRLAVVMMPGL